MVTQFLYNSIPNIVVMLRIFLTITISVAIRGIFLNIDFHNVFDNFANRKARKAFCRN